MIRRNIDFTIKEAGDRTLEFVGSDETVDSYGDILEVELATGEINNITNNLSFQAKPYPEFMLELISAGGLIEHIKQKLKVGEL